MKTILTNGHKIELTVDLKTDIETVFYDGKEISSKNTTKGGLHIFEVIENSETIHYEIEFGSHDSRKELWSTVRRNGIIIFTDKNTGSNIPVSKLSQKSIAFPLFIIGIAVFLYYQGFFGPRGEIVADQADNSSTRLGEYSYRITATILNKGRSGEITLTADLKQGGNYWRKEKKRFIESNRTEEFVIDFDEATLFGGEVTYALNCSP